MERLPILEQQLFNTNQRSSNEIVANSAKKEKGMLPFLGTVGRTIGGIKIPGFSGGGIESEAFIDVENPNQTDYKTVGLAVLIFAIALTGIIILSKTPTK